MAYFESILIFLQSHANLISNCLVVFVIGITYSYIELLQITSKPGQIWQIKWGWIYLISNGLIAILALLFTFYDEVDEKFLFGKLLIAGTSGLALLRVISINLKEKGVEDRSYTIIEILQRRIFNEFDRSRSKIDLPKLREIMRPFNDSTIIANNLPLLLQNLMRTLTPEENKQMNAECIKLTKIKDGNEKIKCINLGAIIARYVGLDLLENTLNELKDDLIPNPEQIVIEEDHKKIDEYLKNFS